jgi:hypothetical protein
MSRTLLSAAVALVVMAGLTGKAQAQYSSSFYYHHGNFTYSQGWSLNRGSYSSGFSVSTPRYSFSTGNSYGGGDYSHHSYCRNRNHAYGQSWSLGRGRYSSGTYYRHR